MWIQSTHRLNREAPLLSFLSLWHTGIILSQYLIEVWHQVSCCGKMLSCRSFKVFYLLSFGAWRLSRTLLFEYANCWHKVDDPPFPTYRSVHHWRSTGTVQSSQVCLVLCSTGVHSKGWPVGVITRWRDFSHLHCWVSLINWRRETVSISTAINYRDRRNGSESSSKLFISQSVS